MKKLSMSLLAVALIAGLQAWAFAAEVRGTVASVDGAAGQLVVQVTDAAGAVDEKAISVDAATQFTGVASVEELEAGDEVAVMAEEDAAAGGWKATSVEVVM